MADLRDHRICNARYGQVACFCSAVEWMTLDEYGEHIEHVAAIAVREGRAAGAAEVRTRVEALFVDEYEPCARAARCQHPECETVYAVRAALAEPECVHGASCEHGDHTYSWPCDYARPGRGGWQLGSAMADHIPGVIYLLHFDEPYKHARHYMGWASDLDARLAEHAAGRGARLLAVIRDAGIGWTLARTWAGDRYRERALKNQGGASRRCPLCGVTPANRTSTLIEGAAA